MHPIEQSRIETKFIGPTLYLQHVIAWLKQHPLLFRQQHEPQQVNNIYFDDYELTAYEDNLAGISDRTKLRLRWYGEELLPTDAIFEIKRKHNTFGWKLRSDVTALELSPTMNWPAVIAAITEKLPHTEQQLLQDNPLVVLINRYQRYYYCTPDAAIRVTLDTNLAVYDQRYSTTPNLDRGSLLLPKQMVAEFKFDRHLRDQVNDMLVGLPLRASRHSKYVNGIRSFLYA